MCIIAHCEERKLSKEEFKNCWDNNDDGFGIGWKKGDVYKYEKGIMNYENAWKFYKDFDKLPHTCHFRITSTGKTIPELTHPFIVNKKSPIKLKYSGKESLLFHNGTISDWERFGMSHFVNIGQIPEGPMSDTRIAAMLVSKLGARAIDFFSGKFVLWLDKIWLYGHFEEEKGVYFSNKDYKYTKWATRKIGYGFNSYVGHETHRTSNYYEEFDDDLNQLDENFKNVLDKDRAYSKMFCSCAEPDPWDDIEDAYIFEKSTGSKFYCAECGLQIDEEQEVEHDHILDREDEDADDMPLSEL